MTAETEKKPPRKTPAVLVSIPGWPTQDPGRTMVYAVRQTPMKAARLLKRLRAKMPEYEWSVTALTKAEVTEVRHAPFTLAGPFAKPVKVEFNRFGIPRAPTPVVTPKSEHDRTPDPSSDPF